jgi:hypothetical protein
MKRYQVRVLPKALPRVWGGKGVLLERDIRASRRGRLRAKLLVFDSRQSLRRFWQGRLAKAGHLGRGCLGAVNALSVFCRNPTTGRECLYVDRRYFCVIGLVRTRLWATILMHEAAHAGFCYARRLGGGGPFAKISDMDEEKVCYPAGNVAGGINVAVRAAGFYKKE